MWYEIGENALRLNKYLIARNAFENCLSIDSSDWFSLDNLIVILFALGNYSTCLEYTFDALKLDKFYLNGLIVLKKIEMLDCEVFSNQVKIFVEINYIMHGIDIDAFLARMDEDLYEEFIKRIDLIKLNNRNQLIQIRNNCEEFKTGSDSNCEIKVPIKPSSWESFGDFILKLNETCEIV